MKTYYIKTFGCQMNEHDSEILAGMLENIGYRLTDTIDRADFVLLNTCCIRETAENKVFSFLGRLKSQKISNPAMLIGVCGCMTQQTGMASRLRQLFPYVDLIFGTQNIDMLPVFVERIAAEGNPLVRKLLLTG